ncbi:PREDICTED: uncharacterized protein LOC106099912 isoform X1 [Papilio polytes]|uniref:uncharacterized protein LOC106099912 isoform X1 n=1 Tax=Papilio polytes TaxID=76194 RepID=UPI000676651D|nr:PREDICTED: uncharacterized protein LOC106099912 isoform X1 [Papilio polytes]
MPPKAKEIARKVVVPVNRPDISDASLNFVPGDAVEGYQERIETGVDWTIQQEAARYCKHRYHGEVPEVLFSQALHQKISKSVLGGFLDKHSNISLQNQWEIILPTAVWDNEKFANEESKICWQNDNCITDDLINLIKNAVSYDDRKILEHDFKNVNILRVNDCKMTKLDKGLTGFRRLVRLNLCGNFLSDIDAGFMPRGLRALEMQSNFIKSVEVLAAGLPSGLLYLGLGKNVIDGVEGISKLPDSITVLDLSDNDICDLEATLNAMSTLPNLVSLQLAGNPCAVCAGYARFTLSKLPRLQWLDMREVLPTDRPDEHSEIHPDDLRSTYFNFTIFRIISAPQPPKGDKGAIMTFHVELELPLLDAARRNFLMFRNNESLIEMLPPPEDDLWEPSKIGSMVKSKSVLEGEASSRGSHIFHLTAVDSREIRHYTVFESNRVPWNKIMNFQEPAVRIFCPNLFGLRDTFRTVVTLRLVYTVSIPIKQGKADKKSVHTMKAGPQEQRATIATIKCALNRPDWTQASQDYHWDDTLDDDAIYYGDGDLSSLQYSQAATKVVKGKTDTDQGSARQQLPENMTCHFGFGIDTLRY